MKCTQKEKSSKLECAAWTGYIKYLFVSHIYCKMHYLLFFLNDRKICKMIRNEIILPHNKY